ncbi:helix-turn-helix domain-containing protein [Bittarella massiliensis (ex Durand et al. 2017)]|uniref:helix-turn-helix domain-containing protein n=1 Tax=Bittarella massiliensis (ex Durand et al. 2017) TaxID=1720313 RepID=UPI002109D3C5|nr:helix-turn-helix transcriptional regulator [Bittarella massiliensis (ex Durand et al. 2017)]
MLKRKLLGKRLQRIRKAHGMTQKELARALGVKAPTVIKMEAGTGGPQFDTFVKLTEVYPDVAVEEILCDSLDAAVIFRIKELSERMDHLTEEEKKYLRDVARYFRGVMQKESTANE